MFLQLLLINLTYKRFHQQAIRVPFSVPMLYQLEFSQRVEVELLVSHGFWYSRSDVVVCRYSTAVEQNPDDHDALYNWALVLQVFTVEPPLTELYL